MSSIIFLTLEEVCLLYKQLIEKFGGSFGIRDINLLESAIAQPQSLAFGEYLHKDIHEMAAAYCFHIIKNHPFVDGNKRTGLLSAITFLDKNGFIVQADTESLYQCAINIATSAWSKQDISLFFKYSTRPTKDTEETSI